jgi:hypothetical protein
MSFIVGSGYHYRGPHDEEFFPIWIKNTELYCPSDQVFVVSTTQKAPNYDRQIFCNHNLGHMGELWGKKAGWSGWSGSVALTALMAYNMGKDFIYKESDALWFGDMPAKMYEELGDKQMIFGKKMASHPWMSCSHSIFLIRHSFIIQFLSGYFSLPDDGIMVHEDKFVKLAEKYPQSIGRFSIKCDRERPLPWDAEVWYAQQLTQEELDEAKKRRLI